jgi:hypothetical protein
MSGAGLIWSGRSAPKGWPPNSTLAPTCPVKQAIGLALDELATCLSRELV